MYLAWRCQGVFGIKEFCQGSLELMEFNSVRSFCCGGKVYPRFSENYQEQGCCGNAAYILDKQFCCGDRVIDKILPNGRRQECCGTIVYEPNPSRICCGIGKQNQVLYTNTGPEDSCCGTHVYNHRKSVCCWDDFGNNTLHTKQKNHQCCGTTYYNTLSHDCVDDSSIMPKGKRMCGTQEYNTDEKFCCGNRLYDSPWNPQLLCCGTERYNTTTHRCCWIDTPHVVPANTICCGNSGFYDPESQRCCLNKVVDISGPHQECCGPHLYSTLHESCCMPGHTVYNKVTNKCCKGSVADIEKECCGSTSFDKTHQVCCNKKFTVDKQYQHDDKCCYSQHNKIGIPYDSSSQRCITRGGEATVEKRVPLCGWKVFNKTSDLCCNMVLVPGGQLQGLECCTPGRLAFSPETQICCNSAVYNKTQRNSCLNNDNHRNLVKKNLCSICHFIEDKARAKRLSEQIQNICDKNVIRFIVKKKQVGRHRVKLYGKLKEDRRIKHRHRRRTLVLPCTCSVNTSDMLIVSNKSFKKKHIRLHNLDYILPYSKKILWQFRQLFKTMCTIHR